jgi:hypothetical protein
MIMNPKTILCLALVLSGVLFGCSTAAHRPDAALVPAPLYTRVYLVDTNILWPNFEQRTHLQRRLKEYWDQWVARHPMGGSYHSDGVIRQAWAQLVAEAGVHLQPPGGIFINDRQGTVLVCATAKDQDAIRRVLDRLNGGPVGDQPPSAVVALVPEGHPGWAVAPWAKVFLVGIGTQVIEIPYTTNLTVVRAIAAGGGYTQSAHTNDFYLIRCGELMGVDMDAILSGNFTNDIPLKAWDIIYRQHQN